MEFAAIIGTVFSPTSLLFIFLGVTIGILFGAIPGLNTPIAVALLIPFTFDMTVTMTISIMMGVYMGGVSGGLITAILLRIPGTASAVATTFDGYPMTRQGRGAEALAFGTFASLFGGILSFVALLTLAPVLSEFAMQFGPWEYFGTVFLALSFVALLAKGNIVKGYISLMIGLLITTIGQDPISGIQVRYNFGNHELDNGFHLIAIIIGVFALPEILNGMGKLREKIIPADIGSRRFFVPRASQIVRQIPNMIRSSILGTIIGILPGMGGGSAGLLAYSQAKRFSKKPEEFGKGSLEGLAASESANNATTGGALIPMMALGVPGSVPAAIIMGGLMMQGVTVGPLLLVTQTTIFQSIILTVFVANIFMFVIQASTIRYVARIVQIPKYILLPVITVFCVTGVISLNNRTFDLVYMLGFMAFGFLLERNNYPLAPLVLGAVLGKMLEENLRRAIVYYESFANCLMRPSLGTLFFALGVIIPVISFISAFRKRSLYQ